MMEITRLTPFFEKSNIYLIAMYLKNTFNCEFFDLGITSPPYNIGIEYGSNNDELHYNEYLKFSKIWLKNCYFWAKDTARLCLNIPLDKNKGGQKSVGADITNVAKSVGWNYHSTIIWNEGNISRRTDWELA